MKLFLETNKGKERKVSVESSPSFPLFSLGVYPSLFLKQKELYVIVGRPAGEIHRSPPELYYTVKMGRFSV